MDIEEILSISGKPGLYRMLSQSRTGAIVEALHDKRRFPVTQSSNVSALKDIAIYTQTEEIPLKDVFARIAEKENYQKAIDHKAKADELRAYVEEVVPDLDHNRVYHSDLKKLIQWYNILVEQGYIVPEEESGDKDESEDKKEDTGENAGEES